jgi:DNA-binding MarR family transcriptional regulator
VPTRTRPARADNETAEIAGRLRLSATRLARQLRQESDAGLTPSQLSALSTLERHGRLTLGALAEYERVAPPSITKMIAKLEAADLVARTLDANDRRVAWVTLTPTGERHLTQIRQRKNVWLAARLAELSDDERRRISDALDALDLLTADRR